MAYLTIQPGERALASSIFANAQRLQGALGGAGIVTEATRAAITLKVRQIREEAERLEAVLARPAVVHG